MSLLAWIFCATLQIIFVGSASEEQEVVARILGGPGYVKLVAQEMGYVYKGLVRGFEDTYILIPIYDAYISHSKRGSKISRRLTEDTRVIWAETQKSKPRFKRDYLEFGEGALPRHIRRILGKRNRRPLPIEYDTTFNDELWTQEWYLQDTRTQPNLPRLDLNVLPLYKLGITGKGVRVSILDDGIEHTHDDLAMNYDPEISFDCNEEDFDPMPRYDKSKQNSHGTRCAGEVAMTANNGKCGVGIAFNAKIGGVKLLDGLVNDRIEGTALSYAQDLVDIYSASWGPNDDGRTVDGPGRLAREALERGITKGRKGRGIIYVWASGNGGSNGDNCNCDGYLASPYTVSIGSASQRGEFPWYGEACASTLAVTYSSGAYQDQMIATTDLNNECTIKHTGTSASAPLAAGIIALALEANPGLTWRDVQHLIVWTSEQAPVADNPGWQTNAAGLRFNTRFGYGLMNAYSFVKTASNWTTVPSRVSCVVRAPSSFNTTFSYGSSVTIPINTNGCRDTSEEINYLEHVEVTTNIDYSLRGALEVYLISPQGTKVNLLSPRKLDKSRYGFKDWTFMSVMTWGEDAKGLWILKVEDNRGPEGNIGSVGDTWLTLHGTKALPEHMKQGPRFYNEHYNQMAWMNDIMDSEYDRNNVLNWL